MSVARPAGLLEFIHPIKVLGGPRGEAGRSAGRHVDPARDGRQRRGSKQRRNARHRLQHGAASRLSRPAQMARRGREARRGEARQRALLAEGHRHGVRDGGAHRQRAVLRVRGRARHAAGQPRAAQLLRRQAQEHDARLPDRHVQGRAERRLPHPLCRRHEAHPAEIRRERPGDAERHHRRRDRRHQVSRRRNGTPRTAAATSAPAATPSSAIPTTAGSIAAPTA